MFLYNIVVTEVMELILTNNGLNKLTRTSSFTGIAVTPNY